MEPESGEGPAFSAHGLEGPSGPVFYATVPVGPSGHPGPRWSCSPGPHQSPLNGDLDLRLTLLGAGDLAVLSLRHEGGLAQSLDDADFG